MAFGDIIIPTKDGTIPVPSGVTGLTDAELRASPVAVTGKIEATVTNPASSSAPSNNGGGLTDAELRASPVPVSVTGGGGGLTDAELRASPVPVSVSGAVTVNEPVSVDDNGGSLTVDGAFLTNTQLRATPVPVSGPLTDTELRAAPVPVSGPLTDTQLRASPVPVSGTVSVNEPVSVDDNGASLTVDNANLDVALSTRAAEHTTAASPHSARLSDGAAFYDAAKTGQLPSALVGGRLDANVGAWLGSTAPTVGQKTMANSVPMAIASDQSAIAVTGPLTDSQLRATPVPVSGTVSTKTNLTPASPTAASVGVASAQVVASNSNRKGLVLTNTSNATISLSLVAAAVLNSGITLFPGDSFSMDETSFYTGAINAIASAAASNLAIQEFST